MSIDLETQRNIASFLSIAIEHSLDLYIEQTVDKPKPHDKNNDVQSEKNVSIEISTPLSSRKPPINHDQFHADFENYLCRLKGCLGQIDTLSKLAITISKNNLFNFNQPEELNIDVKSLNFIKALNDIHERKVAQIENLKRYKEPDHDQQTSN